MKEKISAISANRHQADFKLAFRSGREKQVEQISVSGKLTIIKIMQLIDRKKFTAHEIRLDLFGPINSEAPAL